MNCILDKWSEDMARCVAGYVKYQKSKSDKHSRETKLIPLLKEERTYKEMAMVFVSKLP